MSWDTISSREQTCFCKAGVIATHVEMDDWNRTRETVVIHCERCRTEDQRLTLLRVERAKQRHAVREEAKSIAEERYLTRWMARFSGKSKREIWLALTGGHGYPALGTFYKQIASMGVDEYLRREFLNKLPGSLRYINVEDADVADRLRDIES